MIGAVGTVHFASLRLARPGLIVFAFDVFRYLPCLRSRGVNAVGREVRIRAGAASRFANVNLLLRAGGCDAIDLHPMRFG